MRALLSSLLALFIMSHSLAGQDKPAYALFDAQGRQVTYQALLERALSSDVVLFGELHNNPISHWLQLELATDLHARLGERLVLGAEMFETDDQILLDEYLSGTIAERNFKAEAKLWNNYDTDYRPLVELAREQGLRFVATNIPRRYAALVNRLGFEALEELGEQAKRLLPPLPVAYDPELPGYKAMLDMGGMPGHTNENFPRAQAIKDATMAHFIYQNLLGGGVFLHFHGAYHSNHYEGIVWYLRRLSERLGQLTISTVEQEETGSLEESHLGMADFIIVVPATMTKTY